ncbi:phage tail protein [Thalassospira sp.]|uniref:phage tail protein n=1 Tax=Thalassospira sp. TaxID=1912094 RepID=UPI002735752F|nr:phage tail protein [Thalassospira sp.]MDP2697586.1 phage tail protein [Thalassospira sp.]
MQCNTPVASEVLNVVLAANIAPDRQDDTQLLQAINALIAQGGSGGGNGGGSGSGFGAEIGSVSAFAMPTPPEGWLVCDGSAVSRTDYADLFATIGTLWGHGNQVSTFNLPDLRGEFIRGFDDGRGVDVDRTFGSVQLDAVQNFEGEVYLNNANASAPTGIFEIISGPSNRNGTGSTAANGLRINASNAVRVADETRPRNIAMTYAIKAFYPVAAASQA